MKIYNIFAALHATSQKYIFSYKDPTLNWVHKSFFLPSLAFPPKKKKKQIRKIFLNTNFADRDCKFLINLRTPSSFPIAQQPQAAQCLLVLLLIHQESYHT